MKLLVSMGRFKFPVIYLLLCSTSCMYQRFYAGYADDLTPTVHRHPHPAVRDDVSQIFAMTSICDALVRGTQDADG
jgi:hypothetical protein